MRITCAALAATILVGGAAGCTGALPGDKLGSGTVQIRLATIDDVNSNGQSFGPEAFVNALAEVSGGRMQVDVDLDTFARGEADDESDLVRAIATGEIDGGWPSVRAFAEAGIAGLELVEAPMMLTSYDALRELATSPLADSLLGRLEGTGVQGLSLAVGPLRRPFSVDSPLLEPADWAGQRVRVYNSPVQRATIEALGAEPVPVGFGWVTMARSGDLQGVEFDLAQYWANGMTTEAGQIPRNVVLWPKVFVLAVSERFMDRLTDEQRAWVTEAADRASRVSVDGTYDEDLLAGKLCAQGAEFPTASDQQLDQLREAVQPVIAGLAEDPLWPQLQAIAERHPEPEELDVPAGCTARATTVSGDPGPAPSSPAGLPEGRYRVQITQADLEAAGLDPGKAEGQAGTYTLTVSDGSYQIDCTPVSPPGGLDCWYAQRLPVGFDYNPREVGTITGQGDTVFLAHDPEREQQLTDCVVDPNQAGPDYCAGQIRTRVTWTLEGDVLEFGDQTSTEPWWAMSIKPWTRIS
jgi:TRAP-type C4-dicarboxylate transport system substrate-binding protein